MYPGLTFHGVWVCEIRGLWVLVTLIGSNERLQARLILDAVRESLHVHDAAFTPLYTVCLPVLDSIHTLKFRWRANVTLIKDDYDKLYIYNILYYDCNKT